MPATNALNSACRCGRVRILAAGKPLTTVGCYCRSCGTASTALGQLRGAISVVRPDGSTEYALFRKDRVSGTSGHTLLAEYHLTPNSPTRRVVATCCNTPMFLDFSRGHWLSLYRQSIESADRPVVAMGVMARHRIAASEGSTLTIHSSFPLSLFARLIIAWVVMGFRRPTIHVARALEL